MTKVALRDLQLLGVASMLVASKYEEMKTTTPMVKDFAIMTGSTYTSERIQEMEGEILSTLGFELGKPFCLQFLQRNSKVGQVRDNITKTFLFLINDTAFSAGPLVSISNVLIVRKILCQKLYLGECKPLPPVHRNVAHSLVQKWGGRVC